MNKEYKNVSLPVAGARISDTITVNGQIQLEHETEQILMCSGNTVITDAKPSDGKVECSGKLNFSCICKGTNEGLYSFSASADFSHEIICADANANQNAVIFAQVSEISAEISGDLLTVKSEIELFCRLEEKATLKMYAASKDAEIKEATYDYREKERVGHVDSYVREDISAGNIKSVIYTDAAAVVRDISAVVDKARIDGILNMNALCTAKDGSYFHFRQSIPFTVEAETKYDNCKNLSASVSVSDVRLRITEEEYGLASLDAKVHADVYSSAQVQVGVIEDAYSPDEPFTCEKKSIQLLLFRDTLEQKAALKAQMPIDNMQEYSEPLFCTLTPQVNSAVSEDGAIRLDGAFQTELMYTDKSGNMHVRKDLLPYSVRLPKDFENTEIDAIPVCTSVNYGMRNDKGIELDVSLSVSADIYEIIDTEIVTGTEECDKKPQKSGFTVCFARKGETTYDLAKRFCVSQKSLREANPDLGDVLHEGEKAVVIN